LALVFRRLASRAFGRACVDAASARARARAPPIRSARSSPNLVAHPDLEGALAICLALLDREPKTYPHTAAKSASRFAIERRLTLTDMQLALSALASLPGESACAGAEALIELADRYRPERIYELLSGWFERSPVGA